MGQYYKALVIKEYKVRKANKYGCVDFPSCTAYSLNPFDYDNTYKLMESSYLGNEFADTVKSQFVRPMNDPRIRLLAYVGDYSEENEHVKVHPTLNEYRYEIRDAHNATWNPYGDRALRRKGLERTKDISGYIMVNRTLRAYVDPSKCPEIKGWEGTRIDPLPILCATSNGLGGGDYHGDNEELAGSWAFHDIVVVPKLEDVPDDYTELIPAFNEHWD